MSTRSLDHRPLDTGGTARTRNSRVVPRSVLIAGILLLLVGGGVAAAFTIPAISLSAERSIGEMLPATTVLYLAADLNPAGTKQANLERITHAFTDQSGWKHISDTFNAQTLNNSQNAGCANKVRGDIQSNLDQLGHTTVLAVIDSNGLDLSALRRSGSRSADVIAALKRNAVVLAPLAKHMTLIQALGGKVLQLQHTSTDYRGTAIYQESFSACTSVSQGAPQVVYAALIKGYAVFGLVPDPIKRIVDTAAGTVPSLVKNANYRALESQLTGDPLGSYFVNGSAFQALHLGNTLRQLNPTGASASQSVKSSAGALFAEPYGFRLATTTLASSSSRGPAQPATVLAGQVSGDTLGLIAVQHFGPVVRGWERQYSKDSHTAPADKNRTDRVVNDFTADMTGETDLALLHPATALDLRRNGYRGLPLTVQWQVRDATSAEAHLADLFKQARVQGLTTGTTADGTTYHATSDGYGYAIRQGWAIVSTGIAPALTQLGIRPARTVQQHALYRAAVPSGISPGSSWYLDITGIRQQVEKSFGAQLTSPSGWYRTSVQPLVAPLQIVTGSGGFSRDGKVAVSTWILGIGRPG